MTIEQGGKTVYGACLGILMLETKFPRIFGDMGNAYTWKFPVQYRIVNGANPNNVICDDPRKLKNEFIDAALDLVKSGCDGLTTNCGFLSLIQNEISSHVPIPFAASALMQIPMIQQLLPKSKRVGIITISKQNLSMDHLKAANVPVDIPIVGTENRREFTNCILNDQPQMNLEECRLDLLDSAKELVSEFQNIGAILLECTNMTPYASEIRKITGLPVFSIYSFINWFYQGLMPDQFSQGLTDPGINFTNGNI